MHRNRAAAHVGALTLTLFVVAGCVPPAADPQPTSTPSSTSTETPSPTPPSDVAAPVSPAASAPATPTPQPGEPCDPAAGDPDCTDASSDGTFRLIVGYADCVVTFTPFARPDEVQAPGVCADLDGDGHWGYPEYDEHG